jgi:hypothetical protein
MIDTFNHTPTGLKRYEPHAEQATSRTTLGWS